ncbi:MAG: hypothetical protein LUG96_11245 [Tannerellaceae bacterium]|nr:hypothetical protein [Tannerellaceae bacterium]
MLFSFLLFITSCEEKEDKNNLLADSDWRLVSMENNKTNEVTTSQREGNEYYFLSFGRSHTFTGFGAVNEFSSTYQVFPISLLCLLPYCIRRTQGIRCMGMTNRLLTG